MLRKTKEENHQRAETTPWVGWGGIKSSDYLRKSNINLTQTHPETGNRRNILHFSESIMALKKKIDKNVTGKKNYRLYHQIHINILNKI